MSSMKTAISTPSNANTADAQVTKSMTYSPNSVVFVDAITKSIRTLKKTFTDDVSDERISFGFVRYRRTLLNLHEPVLPSYYLTIVSAHAQKIVWVRPVTGLRVTLFVALYAAIVVVAVPSLAADGSGKYFKVPNKELKTRALALVKGIRELVYSYSNKDRNLTADFDTEYLATRTTERQLLRDQWRKKIDEAQGVSVRTYQRDFASDATLVREELQRRLPKSLDRRDLAKLYANPPNVLALELIADDLELLSKSLPDT
jgi:hypothetical protein